VSPPHLLIMAIYSSSGLVRTAMGTSSRARLGLLGGTICAYEVEGYRRLWIRPLRCLFMLDLLKPKAAVPFGLSTQEN